VIVMAGPPRAVRERVRVFWRARLAGASVAEAAAAAGVSESGAHGWVIECGGVIPSLAEPSGRYLTLAEREEIAAGWHEGLCAAAIGRRIGRHRGTVSRELVRNQARNRPARAPRADGQPPRRGPVPGTHRGRDRPQYERLPYRASLAQAKAETRARRPKHGKLAGCPELREQVQTRLSGRWSPEQIARTLRADYPDRPEMQVSHETIYQALYVQGRGELRRELTRCLRTGRALRKPHRVPDQRRHRGGIPNMINISERPPEVADRAVPGHIEGDLIIGRNGRSAIATLVERATRFVMLLHLPHGHTAEAVRDAMLVTIPTLPTHLRRSLTWDQGREMARHAEITLATGMDVYFCDPHSPWRRGSNENTNGLLRQYFPKGTDLSVHSAEHLAAVAAELNARPRKTLDWKSPAHAYNQLLSNPPTTTGVATTT
jgi:IS30 family transposase